MLVAVALASAPIVKGCLICLDPVVTTGCRLQGAMPPVNRTMKVVKPMSTPETPIVCTLDGVSFAKRVGTIGALFARSLKSSRIEGNSLHLTFDAAARANVEDLLRTEKACCAFLDFELADE